MSTKTTKMTTDASEEDRRCVQGIEDDDGGGSGSITGPVYWQRQQSVDVPCFYVANINTVSFMSSHCLVFIFFSSDSFYFRSLHEILSVIQSCGKYFVPSVH